MKVTSFSTFSGVLSYSVTSFGMSPNGGARFIIFWTFFNISGSIAIDFLGDTKAYTEASTIISNDKRISTWNGWLGVNPAP